MQQLAEDVSVFKEGLPSLKDVKDSIADIQKKDGMFLWLSGGLEIGISSANSPGDVFVDDAYLEVAVDITGSEPMEPTIVHLRKKDVLAILKILGLGTRNGNSNRA